VVGLLGPGHRLRLLRSRKGRASGHASPAATRVAVPLELLLQAALLWLRQGANAGQDLEHSANDGGSPRVAIVPGLQALRHRPGKLWHLRWRSHDLDELGIIHEGRDRTHQGNVTNPEALTNPERGGQPIAELILEGWFLSARRRRTLVRESFADWLRGLTLCTAGALRLP